MPLFNNLQSPLFSVPFSSPLPFNRYSNRYLNKPNSNIYYFNNKLNSNTIKALQLSFNRSSSSTHN